MASTTFTDYSTPIMASWLNDVNRITYTILGNASTTSAALTALGATSMGGSLFTVADAASARTLIGAGTGGGDASTNTSTSVDSEVVLFSSTSGKTLKRASITGTPYLTSGVLGLNKVTFTQPATGSTLTIVDGKTLTANNSISVSGVDGKTVTFNNSITYAGTDGTTMTMPGASDTLAGLGTVQTFTKAQRGAYTSLTDGATITPDFTASNQFNLSIGGNRTLGAPTTAVAGQTGAIYIRQDTTGSRTLAYAWPYMWAGGTAAVLSTAGCSLDQLVYDIQTWSSSTVTITIAAPGVVTWTGHGFVTGQRVQITTTGALPTGLTASTTYFWTTVDANSGKLSTTLANAAAGTYITTTGTQSGVHTMTAATIVLSLNKAYA